MPGGHILATDILYKEGPLFRMKGLLGRAGLGPGEGILLMPCNAIHMFFMKFPIDAVFLDSEFRVVRIAHAIRPWRVSPTVRGARAVLEIGAGQCRASGVTAGTRLCLEYRES